jgi:mRNA interferase YafQ
MRKLVLTTKFIRALRKFCRRDNRIKIQVQEALKLLEDNIFANNLNTHQLKGEFTGFYACSCGYDCRIIFALEFDGDTGIELIILANVGTHDQVY